MLQKGSEIQSWANVNKDNRMSSGVIQNGQASHILTVRKREWEESKRLDLHVLNFKNKPQL